MISSFLFKQIWPDQGDWNLFTAAKASSAFLAHLNKFDPAKGIETLLATTKLLTITFHLNKFDPIKGIETTSTLCASFGSDIII